MWFCNCSIYCCLLLYVNSSFAIILMGKRQLVALLSLSSWCLVIVVWLFLPVPWVCLQFVIVVFPDHTHYICKYFINFWFSHTLLVNFHYFKYGLILWFKNSVDPDQLASNEASRSGSTLFSKEGIEFWKGCEHSALSRLIMVNKNIIPLLTVWLFMYTSSAYFDLTTGFSAPFTTAPLLEYST